MLVELRLVEQRYQAVLEVLDGANVSAVAIRFGVTRQTVHRWLRRYAAQGWRGWPTAPPRRLPARTRWRQRSRHGFLSCAMPTRAGDRARLRHRLDQEGIRPLPGRSSIYRCLVRHGLIDRQGAAASARTTSAGNESRAMELWQMDIVGRRPSSPTARAPRSSPGSTTTPASASRARLVLRATARPVCDALVGAMRVHGVPEADPQRQRQGLHRPLRAQALAEVLFDRICRRTASATCSPRRARPPRPASRALPQDAAPGVLGRQVFVDLDQAQAELDRWVHSYNHDRPHHSLGDRPPVERFALAAGHVEPVEELVEPPAPPVGPRPAG